MQIARADAEKVHDLMAARRIERDHNGLARTSNSGRNGRQFSLSFGRKIGAADRLLI